MTSEYDTAIAFLRQFHSRQVATRPSVEAPHSGGSLSSIDEGRSNAFDDSSRCLQNKNRIVRVRTVRCLVELEIEKRALGE
mmetsp:Transcript_23965/g.37572  ORF Transcript_23965/g.37572 Transcript_23965/m.37572 type:complete len:81 (-) Transcript_23965:190-432(-)|eukprot:CAMPEP_0201717188 /NCGR_PEP_ID=MMETSP0593-20130828/2968_1 /ASSEMBLY_ACC=CAM_ASM_000672 /TAXON_ID=267983 /ORGANISM="Skeletonema japonicum, Strain CCMP2506" /LENGTH=80 /DNA_ID=CAMNT_0048207159 /DNA_START=181 /DNA_END=423 /DNA_ORIENTATION=+